MRVHWLCGGLKLSSVDGRRRAAKRVEDDDPDYEVGEEERERVRVRPSRSRHGGSSRSGGYGGANELSELRDQWVRAWPGPATA